MVKIILRECLRVLQSQDFIKKNGTELHPTSSSPFITTTSSYNPTSHPTNQPLFLYVYLTDRVQSLSCGLRTEHLPLCSVHMAHLRMSTKGLDLTKWHAGSYQRSSFNRHSLQVIAKEKD
jgi:hypothetical protein